LHNKFFYSLGTEYWDQKIIIIIILSTLLPWARGKPMAWDATVSDTYAESQIGNTATKPGAAAQKTAQNNNDRLTAFDPGQPG